MVDFLSFIEGPLDRWAERVAGDGVRPWLFQHVPKTGGTSVTAGLAAAFAPYRNLFVTVSRTGGRTATR